MRGQQAAKWTEYLHQFIVRNFTENNKAQIFGTKLFTPVLRHCWLGVRKGIRSVNEGWCYTQDGPAYNHLSYAINACLMAVFQNNLGKVDTIPDFIGAKEVVVTTTAIRHAKLQSSRYGMV